MLEILPIQHSTLDFVAVFMSYLLKIENVGVVVALVLDRHDCVQRAARHPALHPPLQRHPKKWITRVLMSDVMYTFDPYQQSATDKLDSIARVSKQYK